MPSPRLRPARLRLDRLRIIFPEGFTVREMGNRVAAVAKIAIARRGVTPRLTRSWVPCRCRAREAAARVPSRLGGEATRGLLFPALYEFSQYTTGRELVADQLAAFRKEWARIDLRYARSKNLTPYDVLVIASMIEEETVAPEERRLVAAVIYNRLRRRMPLGIDATIRYGLGPPRHRIAPQVRPRVGQPVQHAQAAGLPPTPITNPGLAVMKAAANPARVDYLYFVRKPDKVHHFFTADENEFLRKACEYGFGCN